jgi:hypothetical protein
MAHTAHVSTRAPEPATRSRTLTDACVDAAFDAVAAAACMLAWVKPQALAGVDLIAWTAPLAFVQMPLALIAQFSGVLRLTDSEMSRATKRAFILAPTLMVGLFAPSLLGPEALYAVAWLAASLLWRVWRGGIDREAAVEGLWIAYSRERARGAIGGSYGVDFGSGAAGAVDGLRHWRVAAGHTQVMAHLTLITGMLLAFVLPFIELDRFGVAIAIEQASAWAATPIGGIVGAPTALAAGTALFGARALLQFEGIAPASASPKPTVDNDPVLRDIVRKLDGDPPPRRRKRRR